MSNQIHGINNHQVAVERRVSDLSKNQSSEDMKKLKEAAQGFESLFLNIVLKSMRKSIMKSKLVDGGNAENIYQSMLDGEYAKIMSNTGSLGLAAAIEKQVSRMNAYNQAKTSLHQQLRSAKENKTIDIVVPHMKNLEK